MTREEDLAAAQAQFRPETTMEYDSVLSDDQRDALYNGIKPRELSSTSFVLLEIARDMSDDSEGKASEGFSRKELIDDQLLHTEYEQAGEEYRYRDRLLHNSYYLLIVVTALLAGPFLRYAGQDAYFKLGVIVLLAGGLYTLLGLVMLTHYVQRNSASSLRTRVEQVADGTKECIPRPFAVQYRVIGQDTRMTDEHELDEARPFFSRVLGVPEYLHSAETLAQAILAVGFMLIVASVGILTSGWPFVYNLISTLGALVAVGAFVLWLRSIDSDLEFR